MTTRDADPSEPSPDAPTPGVLARWLPEDNPAGIVYGLLVVGTLLAAEGTHGIGYLKLIGAVATALVVYWLAHAYAAVLGLRIASTERWTLRRLLGALAHEFAIIRGALLPLLALVIAGALGAPISAAVTIALTTCAVSVVLLEVLAGVGEGLGVLGVLAEALVGATLGLGLFAVRVLLH